MGDIINQDTHIKTGRGGGEGEEGKGRRGRGGGEGEEDTREGEEDTREGGGGGYTSVVL